MRTLRARFLIILGSLVLLFVAGSLVWDEVTWRWEVVQAESCDPRQEDCANAWITLYLRRRGIAAAFDELARRYEEDPSMGPVCHSLTHTLGRSAYDLFARGKTFAVTPKTAYCSYGFFHGFMEELAASSGDIARAREFCAFVDEQISKEAPDAGMQCYHGIGHGTVNNHDPATWGNEQLMIAPALELCKKAATDELQLSRCATGVFNGIATFYQDHEYNLVPRASDPFWICRLYEPIFEDACYLSLNITILDITNNDLAKALPFVEGIANDAFAQHAVLNLLAPVGAKRVGKESHDDVVAACRGTQERLRIACLQGYAYGFLEHGKPGEEYKKPLEFCGSDLLTTEEQNGCFEYIFTYFRQWYSQGRAQGICRSLDEARRAQCLVLSKTQ